MSVYIHDQLIAGAKVTFEDLDKHDVPMSLLGAMTRHTGRRLHISHRLQSVELLPFGRMRPMISLAPRLYGSEELANATKAAMIVAATQKKAAA